MNNTIQFNNPISINEAYKLLMANGDKLTYLFRGEPGIGKSTLHSRAKRELGDDEWDHIYIDWSSIDMGDLFIRAPNRDTGELEFFPSSLVKPKSNKKKFIMIDELGKGDKLLLKLAMRLVLEHQWGDYKLPEGSVVFCTTNNPSDNVGDFLHAHGTNRVTLINIQKPTEKVWLPWASENGVSAVIRAWVAMNPRCLASYLDGGQDENPYIFNPNHRGQGAFVSPRSLAKADHAVRARDDVGDKLTQAALAGTIGAAAAESMAAFMSLEKELISIKKVLENPDGVDVPEKPAALFLMMFNAIDSIETQDDLSKFMRFVNRLRSSEVQAVFFTMLLQSNRTARIAKNNQQVMEWAKDNFELLI